MVSVVAAAAIFCACVAFVSSSGGSKRVSFSILFFRVPPRPLLSWSRGSREKGQSAQHLPASKRIVLSIFTPSFHRRLDFLQPSHRTLAALREQLLQ